MNIFNIYLYIYNRIFEIMKLKTEIITKQFKNEKERNHF